MNSPAEDLADFLKFESAFQDHCASLVRDGIGDISEMCHRSIVRTFHQDPRFLSIFQKEGDRFSAMAERVLPTSLVAEHMRLVAASHPQAFLISPKGIDDFFIELKKMTNVTQEHLNDDTRNHSGAFRFKPSEMSSYLTRCATNPSLQLTCIYYGVELQGLIDLIIEEMKAPQHTDALQAFGAQMNAKNLTTALPLAIHIALEREHGIGAREDLIDITIMENALRFMDANEQFESKGTGMGSSGRIENLSIRCPMKRYVFNLLLKQNGFLPYFQAVRGLSKGSKDEHAEQVIHRQNMVTIAKSAAAAAREYQ